MKVSLRFDALTRYLIPASLFYLALPYAIFFVGWLKWYVALLCLALVAFPPVTRMREIDQIMATERSQSHASVLSLHHLILVLVASLLFLGVSGVGGYGHQDTDWLKHNAILKDLIERPWPVRYRLGGQDVPLVYYIAYYLPAAALGKLGGWSLANQVLFAWSWIGLILAMLWFVVLNRHAALSIVWLFVAFSGLDVIGEFAVTPAVAALRPEASPFLNWDHIEPWAIGWQYSSNVTLLFWVPNQALAGWIASGLLVYTILHSSRRKYSLFYWSLTALWSPFVTIGLLPYLLAESLLENGTLLKRLRRYISPPNLCGLLLLLVIGLFYSAKLYEASPLLTADIPHGFSLSFAADAEAKVIGGALILVFCLLEFGLYGILIYGTRRDWNAKAKVLFVTTIVCLALIPLYRYGATNDFAMRASIPALFVLAVFLGRALHSRSLTGLKRIALIALVILGSGTVLVEFRRHVEGINNAGTILQTPNASQVTSLGLWDLATEKDHTIMLQYVGSSQAPFFEFMTREH